MQDIKQTAKIMFRKLWGGINKENQHLTTEKVEDLLDTVISLAVEQEKARRDKEWVDKINEVTDYDHSKCPIKETCIGYGNCVSDIKNGVIDNLINNR